MGGGNEWVWRWGSKRWKVGIEGLGDRNGRILETLGGGSEQTGNWGQEDGGPWITFQTFLSVNKVNDLSLKKGK